MYGKLNLRRDPEGTVVGEYNWQWSKWVWTDLDLCVQRTAPSPTWPKRGYQAHDSEGWTREPIVPMCNTHVHTSAYVPSPECLFSFLSLLPSQTSGPYTDSGSQSLGERVWECLGISANNNIAYQKTKVRNGFVYCGKHDNVTLPFWCHARHRLSVVVK